MSDRVLPGSAEAERIVLGAVLIDYRRYWADVDEMAWDEFILESHRRIFKTMRAISESGSPLDRITLAEHLRANGMLESVGGMSYIIELDDALPQIVNLSAYVEIVRNAARRRKLINHSELLQDALYSGTATDAEIEKQLTEMADVAIPARSPQVQSVGEMVMEAGGVDRFFGVERGVPVPWANLQQLMPIFPNGSLTVVAASPGMGKSAFAGIVASHCARNLYGAAIWSLEMTGEEIVKRLLADDASIAHATLTRDSMDREQRSAVQASISRLDELPLWISRRRSLTVPGMRADIKRLRARNRLVRIGIVDYLQLMSGKGRDRREQITEITRGLKLLAMEEQIPIIALSQLTREPVKEDRRPELQDLRESGSIEQDANNVIFLWCKKNERDNAWRDFRPIPINAYVAKMRNGHPGTARLEFNGKYMRILDSEKE